MKTIEILDSNGGVITRVQNSTEHDNDVAAYGGASWREWQKPAEQVTQEKRQARRQQVRQIARDKAQAVDADLAANAELIVLLAILFDVKQEKRTLVNRIKALHEKRKEHEQALEAMDDAALDAFDPESDWPE